MADDYGATVQGVAALIPGRRITADSKPSEGDVLVYINDSAGIVRSHIGELPAGSGHTGAARALVCTGAAAMYQDAAFPERSGRASDAYGEVLWTRFREGLADLVRRLGSDPAAAVPGAPSYSFPDAMILRDQGW